MKITDLKKQMKDASPKQIEKALVETYKKLPPAKKAEWDENLVRILDGKAMLAPHEFASYEALEEKLKRFIEYVYAGYYRFYNSTISMKERKKWRFEVQHYYKALLLFEREDEHYEESVLLLMILYSTLVDSYTQPLFYSEDAFRSIKISQEQFFAQIATRLVSTGYTRKHLEMLVDLLDFEHGSPHCSPNKLISALLEPIKTFGAKELTRQIAYPFLKGAIPHSLAQYGYAALILRLSLDLEELELDLEDLQPLLDEKAKEAIVFSILSYYYKASDFARFVAFYSAIQDAHFIEFPYRLYEQCEQIKNQYQEKKTA